MANARGLPEGYGPHQAPASITAQPRTGLRRDIVCARKLSRTRPHVRALEIEIRRRHAFVAPLERAAEVPASLPSVFLRALASRGPWRLRARAAPGRLARP